MFPTTFFILERFTGFWKPPERWDSLSLIQGSLGQGLLKSHHKFPMFYILYFLRWHNTLCRLDPALFFRLSRVLCSQDTNFTLSMSFTAYLQTAFLFPLGHVKALRNGPFILVLQTKRTMRYNQVKHSPVCPLLFSFDSVPYIWPLKTYLLEGLSFSNHKTSHSGHKGYLKTFPQCPCFCCASRTERKE